VKRREFIKLLGGAVGSPLAARAQQAKKVYRIGFAANDPTIPITAAGAAFLDGLRENGFVEGDYVVIERRFAEGSVDRSNNTLRLVIKFHLIWLTPYGRERAANEDPLWMVKEKACSVRGPQCAPFMIIKLACFSRTRND
jgi:hypothetical protein